MSLSVAKDQESATPVAPSLGQRAFGGALWTLGQTVGSKIVGIAAQLILAGMLAKDDFGLFAEAILIISLCGLGQQLGLGEILIRRHRHFDKWAQPAFWISLTAGLVGAGAVIAISPFAPIFFKDAHGLTTLLLVAAFGLPFDALMVISQAKLRVDLRFRTLALIGTCNITGIAILSVSFAAAKHFFPGSPISGAMCLILPRPIMSAATMAMSHSLSGLRIRFQPHFSRWRFILRDSKYFFITTIFNTLLMQGDYLLTGIFFSTEQLGAYYFAFNLSTQTVQLVGANLTSVLLPSFAKLDRDPQRQQSAYVKVCSTIAFVGTIMCILQAVIAGPALHCFFGHKWDEAIPLFQILTVGMIFVLPSAPGMSLLQAQGRYQTGMIWTAITAAFFLLSVTFGVLGGSTQTIALADCIFYLIFGPLGVLIPLRCSFKSYLSTLNAVYSFPVAICLLIAIAIALAGHFFRVGNEFLDAAGKASLVLFVYIALVLLFRKRDAQELLERVKPHFSGIFARQITGAAGK
ncbi:MAG TPA: oligosaccharide flippase family protein [Phycisphaerae bacterium]|nr:oligosaccharide flippase family protein [Phycisphaerae bacterium]